MRGGNLRHQKSHSVAGVSVHRSQQVRGYAIFAIEGCNFAEAQTQERGTQPEGSLSDRGY